MFDTSQTVLNMNLTMCVKGNKNGGERADFVINK